MMLWKTKININVLYVGMKSLHTFYRLDLGVTFYPKKSYDNVGYENWQNHDFVFLTM